MDGSRDFHRNYFYGDCNGRYNKRTTIGDNINHQHERKTRQRRRRRRVRYRKPSWDKFSKIKDSRNEHEFANEKNIEQKNQRNVQEQFGSSVDKRVSRKTVDTNVDNVRNSNCIKTEQKTINVNSVKEDRETDKREKTVNFEAKETTSRKSSTSSESDSDCSHNNVKYLREALGQTLLKKQDDCTNNSIKNPEGKISSSSSSDSSDSPTQMPKKSIKKEVNSEDEVVCLGNVERVENLVDDENPLSDVLCLLCDEMGHTSFTCFMVCRNCGEKFHGLKNCPKPANMSIALQSFMEFCLRQFCQFNAGESFSLVQNIQSADEDILKDNLEDKTSANNKRRSETRNPARSVEQFLEMSHKRFKASNSDTLSTEHRNRDNYSAPASSSSASPFPFNVQLPSAMFPISVNPQGIPFNPQGIAINPYLSYGQMLGFNVMNLNK